MTTLQEFRRKRPPNRGAVEAHKAQLLQELHAYRLRELREAMNLTQTELAGILKVAQNRVSNMERGDIEHIKVDTLRRYIEALGARLRIAVDVGDGTLVEIASPLRESPDDVLASGPILGVQDNGPAGVTPRAYSRGGHPRGKLPRSRGETSRVQTSKKDASRAAKLLATPRSTRAQKSVAASDLAQAKKRGGKK